MTEQVTSTEEVGRSVDSIRKQTAQVTQAMSEQARATRDAASASNNVSKQVKLITAATAAQALAAEKSTKAIGEIREITDRNAKGIQASRTVTESIINGTTALVAIAGDLGRGKSPTSGKRSRNGSK
jgi:methyl-accepting chemotaxis protein